MSTPPSTHKKHNDCVTCICNTILDIPDTPDTPDNNYLFLVLKINKADNSITLKSEASFPHDKIEIDNDAILSQMSHRSDVITIKNMTITVNKKSEPVPIVDDSAISDRDKDIYDVCTQDTAQSVESEIANDFGKTVDCGNESVEIDDCYDLCTQEIVVEKTNVVTHEKPERRISFSDDIFEISTQDIIQHLKSVPKSTGQTSQTENKILQHVLSTSKVSVEEDAIPKGETITDIFAECRNLLCEMTNSEEKEINYRNSTPRQNDEEYFQSTQDILETLEPETKKTKTETFKMIRCNYKKPSTSHHMKKNLTSNNTKCENTFKVPKLLKSNKSSTCDVRNLKGDEDYIRCTQDVIDVLESPELDNSTSNINLSPIFQNTLKIPKLMKNVKSATCTENLKSDIDPNEDHFQCTQDIVDVLESSKLANLTTKKSSTLKIPKPKSSCKTPKSSTSKAGNSKDDIDPNEDHFQCTQDIVDVLEFSELANLTTKKSSTLKIPEPKNSFKIPKSSTSKVGNSKDDIDPNEDHFQCTQDIVDVLESSELPNLTTKKSSTLKIPEPKNSFKTPKSSTSKAGNSKDDIDPNEDHFQCTQDIVDVLESSELANLTTKKSSTLKIPEPKNSFKTPKSSTSKAGNSKDDINPIENYFQCTQDVVDVLESSENTQKGTNKVQPQSSLSFETLQVVSKECDDKPKSSKSKGNCNPQHPTIAQWPKVRVVLKRLSSDELPKRNSLDANSSGSISSVEISDKENSRRPFTKSVSPDSETLANLARKIKKVNVKRYSCQDTDSEDEHVASHKGSKRPFASVLLDSEILAKRKKKKEKVKRYSSEDSDSEDDVNRFLKKETVPLNKKNSMASIVEKNIPLMTRILNFSYGPRPDQSKKLKENKKKISTNTLSAPIPDQSKKSKENKTIATNTLPAPKPIWEKIRKSKYRIALTSLSDEDQTESEKIIKKLGGQIVEKYDHVIVAGSIRRTVKLMSSLSNGKPVVTMAFLRDSAKENKFLDPHNYLLVDKIAEKKYKFNTARFLERYHKILVGYTIYITPSINMKPGCMKEIVENLGGKAVIVDRGFCKLGLNTIPKENVITISCEKDKHIYKNLPAPIQSCEFIYNTLFAMEIKLKYPVEH